MLTCYRRRYVQLHIEHVESAGWYFGVFMYIPDLGKGYLFEHC